MEIRIPNLGERVGCCGWLAKGLADGSITIKPGKNTSRSAPGLWIHFGDRQQVLALFNPYGLSDHECANSERCFTTDQAPGVLECCHSFTHAAWDFLMDIAQQWCDAQNETFVKDDPSPLRDISVCVL